MTEIILERVFDEKGKYLGKITVNVKDLTPQFLQSLRDDIVDKKGWRKYRKVMRDHGHDIGEVGT